MRSPCGSLLARRGLLEESALSRRALYDPAVAAAAFACAAAAYITYLTADMRMAPKLPTPAETQGVLLEIKKRILNQEPGRKEGVADVSFLPFSFHTLSFIQLFLPHLRALTAVRR
ncbi:hypothetical protein K438DRAFT_1974479 [Mycena galopus ATCC 62051]|nr:hypothetical protein K438DRAFT_1974479 [Mycena galopus ATCC 62051]